MSHLADSQGTSSSSSGYNVVTSLVLQGEGLTGQLPEIIYDMTTLTTLDLSLNPQLTGSLPNAISQLKNIDMFDLHGCSFHGSLPTALGTLSALRFLMVNINRLTGTIPVQVANMSSVYYFDITGNQISGRVPVKPGFDTALSVGHLHLGHNLLTHVPGELGRLPNLVHLLVDNNRLAHEFPIGLNKSTSLTVIHWSNNTLTGTFPSPLALPALLDFTASNCSMSPQALPLFTLAPKLCNLDLSRNSFVGPIPLEMFANHSTLINVNLAYNELSGTLPPSLLTQPAPNLFSLFLADNELTGSLPDLTVPFPSVVTLSLYDNNFQAAPDNLLNNTNITVQLYGNTLCSPFRPLVLRACSPPSDVMQFDSPPVCESLPCAPLYSPSRPLLMASSSCLCVSPLEMDLLLTAPQYAVMNDELASLMAERIRKTLTGPKLGIAINVDQILVVSVTGSTSASSVLTARVHFFPPDDQPMSESFVTDLKYAFNSHIASLGTDFGPYVVKSFLGPDTPDSSGTSLSIAAIVGIAAAAFVLVAAVLVLLVLLLRAKKAQKDWWSDEDYAALEGINMQGVQRFKLKEISDATDDFKTLLGEGGYGLVYKGTLPSGEIVAVKRAKPRMQQGGLEFRNEMELLSGVRHRNLVELRGFCVEGGEQLLVYEFIEKGTLEDLLRGNPPPSPLTWRQRIEIACGAACGFAYLHHQIKPPIIHRDVKTANILITGSFEAKVADFGISKAKPEDGGKMETEVKGTVGYLDPEYFLTDLLTEKSDVYSFGIVLLELASGLHPIAKGKHIRALVIDRVMQESVHATMDPEMKAMAEKHGADGGADAEAFVAGGFHALDKTYEWFLRLGMRCSAKQLQYRPDMQTVMAELEAMRAILERKGDTKGSSDTPPPAMMSSGSVAYSMQSASTALAEAAAKDAGGSEWWAQVAQVSDARSRRSWEDTDMGSAANTATMEAVREDSNVFTNGSMPSGMFSGSVKNSDVIPR